MALALPPSSLLKCRGEVITSTPETKSSFTPEKPQNKLLQWLGHGIMSRYACILVAKRNVCHTGHFLIQVHILRDGAAFSTTWCKKLGCQTHLIVWEYIWTLRVHITTRALMCSKLKRYPLVPILGKGPLPETAQLFSAPHPLLALFQLFDFVFIQVPDSFIWENSSHRLGMCCWVIQRFVKSLLTEIVGSHLGWICALICNLTVFWEMSHTAKSCLLPELL